MDIPTPERLIELIDAFLLRHEIAPTRFGRDAVNDPNFIAGLRDGRKLPGILRLNQIARYMAGKDAAAGHVGDNTNDMAEPSSGKGDDIAAQQEAA